jgi:cyclic pyranopterin monophosphate synthase
MTTPPSKLTHFDHRGEAHMVDVGGKPSSQRRATAEGRILMEAQTLQRIIDGDHKKGDVLGVARIAGIMAAKNTASLIPLCHPLPLTSITLTFEPVRTPASVTCRVEVATEGKTGVEMEALTGVHIALLTIYDMCKAIDRHMTMTDIRLLAKSGGRSGDWIRAPEHPPG